MAHWTLEGPDKCLLTKKEVCAYLGIGERSLDKLIEQGLFPRGVNVPKTKRPILRWYAIDVACYLHLCERLRPGPLEKFEKGSEDDEENDG